MNIEFDIDEIQQLIRKGKTIVQVYDQGLRKEVYFDADLDAGSSAVQQKQWTYKYFVKD